MRELNFKEIGTFIKYVVRGSEDECWPWTGCKNVLGYGKWALPGKPYRAQKAHRVAYRVFVGEIPSGLHVLHDCDNPPCCNPAHLHLGTHQMNMREAWDRGRQPKQNRRGEKNPRAKMTAKAVSEYRARYKNGGVRLVDLAKEAGVGVSTMWSALSGETWQ